MSKESSFDPMPGVTLGGIICITTFIVELPQGEAARRYYSAMEFSITGVPSVFSPLTPLVDTRFFDSRNIWYRFDSRPLKRSLERFAKFPIATSFDEKSSSLPQPRLLLVSVDVAEGAARNI